MTGPLLQWLLQRYPDTPKTRAKQWILAGRVRVHGEVIRKPHQVMPDPGDGLELGDRHASTLSLGTGWQIHPRVALLHLDMSLAVVNKGAGIISVPAPNAAISALSVLADYLAGRLKPRDRVLASKTLPPPYRKIELLPVHRLDQYTSGVFCMASNPAARENLIHQLQERTMKREYVAFAEGRARQAKGTWRQWLQLSRDEMRQQITHESAKDATEAITHYEVADEFSLSDGKIIVTKLRLRLETGRKHQIRVQAAHAGLPLVGDRVYNSLPTIPFSRQALHARTLSLEHPAKAGQLMEWTADFPKDLRQLEAALRAGRVPED
jgi:23S rRNA pseudouridine1911/1915/1917 synthase